MGIKYVFSKISPARCAVITVSHCMKVKVFMSLEVNKKKSLLIFKSFLIYTHTPTHLHIL